MSNMFTLFLFFSFLCIIRCDYGSQECPDGTSCLPVEFCRNNGVPSAEYSCDTTQAMVCCSHEYRGILIQENDGHTFERYEQQSQAQKEQQYQQYPPIYQQNSYQQHGHQNFQQQGYHQYQQYPYHQSSSYGYPQDYYNQGYGYPVSKLDEYAVDFYEAGYRGPQMSQSALHYLRGYKYTAECGVRRKAIHTRVSTGFVNDLGIVNFGEFPWHVGIFIRVDKVKFRYNYGYNIFRYHCGGSLINSALVLTAAHCVRGIRRESIKVKLGDWNLQGSNGEIFPAVERNLARVIIHEDYNPVKFTHDIALLVLDRTVDLFRTPHVAPVCLPTKNYDFEDASKCFIVGWGSDVYKPNYASNVLKKVSVTIQDDECKNTLKTAIPSLSSDFFHETHRCIIGGYGKDACIGDGGGAVVCPVDNSEIPICKGGYSCESEHYFLAGIISWGNDDCGEDAVTVVTEMASHVSWLLEKISPAGGLERYSHAYWGGKEKYLESNTLNHHSNQYHNQHYTQEQQQYPYSNQYNNEYASNQRHYQYQTDNSNAYHQTYNTQGYPYQPDQNTAHAYQQQYN